MNKYLIKEASKLAMMTASIDDPNLENTDTLSELTMVFYEDIEAFAQMLQFTANEIETMDKTTAEKLISKYID